jgi:hypothetical protein
MFKYIHFTHGASSVFQQPWINTKFVKFMSENTGNKFNLDVLKFYLKITLEDTSSYISVLSALQS